MQLPEQKPKKRIIYEKHVYKLYEEVEYAVHQEGRMNEFVGVYGFAGCGGCDWFESLRIGPAPRPACIMTGLPYIAGAACTMPGLIITDTLRLRFPLTP